MGALLNQEKDLKQNKAVTMDSFEILQLIGKGRFGKVYQVRHLASSNLYAMKILKKSLIREMHQEQQAYLERNILSKLSHIFIIRLQYAFQSSNKLVLVFDLAGGGELFHHLRRLQSFSEESIIFYGAEILTALEYLHNNCIIYQDLKPENILLDSNGHIKLTDFGLAKFRCGESGNIGGTSAYLAPEMVSEGNTGIEVDLWAFGVLLYELATGTTPFYHKNRIQMFKRILGAEPAYPPSMSEALVDLIKSLLIKDPKDRSSIKAVKEHAFFRRVRWETVEEYGLVPPINPQETTRFKEIEDSSPLSHSPVNTETKFMYPDFDYIFDEEV